MGSMIWWLFFSMSAGIGFFWSFLLFFGKSDHRPGTKALGLLLFTFSLTLTHYVMVWSGTIGQFPHLSGLWQASSYLYGPLLLIFFWGKEKIDWKTYIWHLLPAVILLVGWIPFGLSSGSEKLKWMQTLSPFSSSTLLHPKLRYLLLPSLMVGVQFVYGIYFLWRSFQFKNGDRKLKRLIAILFLVFVFAQILYFVLVRTPAFKVEWDYMISLAMTLCIFRIGMMTFNQPEFFFKLKKRSPVEGKYTTSPLSNQQSAYIAASIKKYIVDKQGFLDSELRLPSLAEKLELSPHQVSQAINETFNCSFSEWINQFRVEYACKLLTEQGLSAKEAAYQSGFNSLSSFYLVFKKSKGMTPAKYAKVSLS